MNWRNQPAFTLVELLVVIAIIGVLAAITLAATSQLRVTAAQTQCLANLRQWGVALSLYSAEHDGDIARRGQGMQPLFQIDRPDDWFNSLPPYVGMEPLSTLVTARKAPKPGTHSIFVCPAAQSTGTTYFLPYAMNMYLSPWIRPSMHKLVEIPSPSRLVFLADGPCGYSSTVPSALGYSVQARHRGMANLVFLDGHAASYRGDYLGVGQGEIAHGDVQWQTHSVGVNQNPVP